MPLTILVIASYRLRLVTPPFCTISKTTAKIIVAMTWLIATGPGVTSLAYKSTSTFIPTSAACVSSIYVNEGAVGIGYIGCTIGLPLFAVTFISIILSVIAIKHSTRHSNHQQRNYRALVLVCSVSVLFIISWVPLLVYTLMKMKNPKTPPIVDLLAFHCIFLNSFGNPILYSFTNKKFGNYVKSVRKRYCCSVTNLQSSSNCTIQSPVYHRGAKEQDQGNDTELPT